MAEGKDDKVCLRSFGTSYSGVRLLKIFLSQRRRHAQIIPCDLFGAIFIPVWARTYLF